ncbi:MAG: DNA polymerase III subunit delta' [Calditrichia bacterium]|nr:DNA polymerase III subunit delta' [Calditrichia bacterium]
MDFFKELTIQTAVKDRFCKSMTTGRLAHAYLFYGPEGGGKEAFALEIAKALNCQNEAKRPCNECPSCTKISQLKHPDVKFIIPEAKKWNSQDIQKKYQLKAENPYSRIEYTGTTSISIEKIRDLKNEAKYTPYEGQKKVFILTEAEKITREGANSFLKLLEEPPENLIIILINSSLSTILDTIKSRCQIVYFPTLSFEEALLVVNKYRDISDDERKLVRISQGNLKNIFEILDQEIDDKRKIVYDFLKASASGSAIKILEVVDLIAQRRDKNFLLDILNLLILWFKDTIHIISVDDRAEIINVDFEEEIKRFAKNYTNSDFELIVTEIENAVSNVRNNVYTPLILTVLGIQIRKHLQRTRS